MGRPLGNAVQEMLSLVHYKTFLRWLREAGSPASNKPKRHPGRPPILQNVEELLLRFARETGWGYALIQGELRKLGITVAANTIKKIMIKSGFHPSPNRTKGDWDYFLKRHMDTLWACDFFTKDVWTAFGKVTYYVLFFIPGRVKISGVTVQPNGPWVPDSESWILAAQAQSLRHGFSSKDAREKKLIPTNYEEWGPGVWDERLELAKTRR